MTRRFAIPFVLVLGTVTTSCLESDKDEDEDDDSNVTDNSGWYGDSGDVDTDTDSNAGWYSDDDGDGWYAEEGDCDDADPAVNPDADENCEDEVDNDCDGLIDAADTEDCGEPARATAGLDWQRLEWCAPEGPVEGLRDWRRAGSPFVVTKGE